MTKDRATNRKQRRDGRGRDHEPLLRLAQEEATRRPVRASKAIVKPLNEAQRLYDAAIAANIITFGIGPAGTGKTWLAAMRAAEALKEGKIERLIITRPAVEAEGENLGFMPGELDEKFEPYFRPVREALEECLGSGHLEYLVKAKLIEARPLAFMRGATFKNCWCIADEMQNTTPGQMKLMLTRAGENSKFIVNGDPNQMDIALDGPNGLIDAAHRLKNVKGVGSVRFSTADIVRSGICRAIAEAYGEGRADTDQQELFEDEGERAGLNRAMGFLDLERKAA